MIGGGRRFFQQIISSDSTSFIRIDISFIRW